MANKDFSDVSIDLIAIDDKNQEETAGTICQAECSGKESSIKLPEGIKPEEDLAPFSVNGLLRTDHERSSLNW